MNDLVDDSFCLAYFSLISFKVSLFILTQSIFSRQFTLEIVTSAASFMEATKCFRYSSMPWGDELKRFFELKISAIVFWNVSISALKN